MEPINRITKQPRITLRISDHTLSFSVVDLDHPDRIVYEPYIVRSGISMAANLREAFKTAELLLQDYKRAQVLLDTHVMLVPLDEFEEADCDALFQHTFSDKEQETILHEVLPSLNAVAVFSINKDLKMVVEDHFKDVRISCVQQPVWAHLHRRSFSGSRKKLYGYFHDRKLELFSFTQNRFKFCNTFEVTHADDAVYYLLFVWKQLALDSERDELHIVGTIPETDSLTERLHAYLKNVYVINPSADFNHSPIAQIKGLDYDLMSLYIIR